MDSGNILNFRKRKIGDDIPRREELPEAPKRKWVLLAIVGVVISAGIILWLANGMHHATSPAPFRHSGSFSTAKGEHRCEKLPDAAPGQGTVVCLNTATTVRFVITESIRHLELDSGEITVTVHADTRPLDVGSNRLLTRDLSTEFDVYRKDGSTLVTVIQGAVKLLARANDPSKVDLSHMESESVWKSAPVFHRLVQVEFDEASGSLLVHPPMTDETLRQYLAWQQGLIDMTNKSLGEALHEFGRYQPIEKFTFQDKELRQFRVGGVLGTTHLEDFLDSLDRLYGIKHVQSHDQDGQVVVTLSRRRGAH